MVGLSMFDQARGFVSARLLDHLARAIEEGKEKGLATLFRKISILAPSKYHKAGFERLSLMAEENHPFVGVFRRLFRELQPKARKKFIANFLVNNLSGNGAAKKEGTI